MECYDAVVQLLCSTKKHDIVVNIMTQRDASVGLRTSFIDR
jgi:hypothetical protein